LLSRERAGPRGATRRIGVGGAAGGGASSLRAGGGLGGAGFKGGAGNGVIFTASVGGA
jgi:hypothetical protein